LAKKDARNGKKCKLRRGKIALPGESEESSGAKGVKANSFCERMETTTGREVEGHFERRDKTKMREISAPSTGNDLQTFGRGKDEV